MAYDCFIQYKPTDHGVARNIDRVIGLVYKLEYIMVQTINLIPLTYL